jgi:carbon-monoxide dehydrogenase iron sulfur subunit
MGSSLRGRWGMPQFISIDPSGCTGCKTCEVVCSLHHFGECNPERSAIRVIRREKGGLVFSLPLVCQQCEPAPCVEACPSEALFRKASNAPLTVDQEKCSGCGNCVDACPAGCIFLSKQINQIVCCDLCGGQPQCVPLCHSSCLTVRNSGEEALDRIHRLASILEREDLWESVPGR